MRGIRIAAAVALFAASAVPSALANPDGGQVVAGSATVQGQGTAVVTVNQSSQKTILNWDSFSIKEGELTKFLQPNAQAIALNRVIGGDPSLIYGALSANGRLILINPNGLVIGPSGTVNANSFIASTAGISDENFLAGNLTFDIVGNANARIVNEGTVTAGDAGLVAFVAPAVKNSGLIQAKLGTVTLGAATKFTLDFYGDELVSFPIDAEVAQAADGAKALVEAGGRIEGQNIVLSARAARGVINDVIIADGELIARSASVVDGKIRLGVGRSDLERASDPRASTEFAGVEDDVPDSGVGSIGASGSTIRVDGGDNGRVMLAGLADASGTTGGEISIKGEQAHITGSVRAQGQGGAGGAISVSGTRFVSFGGLLSVDGAIGGTIAATSASGDFSLGGIATARGFAGRGGAIEIIAAGESWEFGGALLDVSGATDGGTIRNVVGEGLVSSATYRARGEAGQGGKIDATANAMFLLSATYDASGLTDGGRVRLGGEFQGGKSLTADELANAATLSINDGVRVDVSSRGATGDGGTAIIWSDQKSIFLGEIDARPGLFSGAGGFVEVSSLEQLIWRGTVLAARNGERGGTLLLDPKNIIIDNVATGPLGRLLDPFDNLGYGGNSVSLDGNQLAIGSFQDDGAGNSCVDCGAVYLFTFTDATFSGGTLVGRIGHGYTGGANIDLAGTLNSEDLFGNSVALKGTQLAVGAHADDGASNSCQNCGAIYLFNFSGPNFSGGTLAGRIGSGYTGGSSLNLAFLEANDQIGTGLSLDGGRLAVGVQGDDGAANSCNGCGAVYLFTFTNSAFSGGVLASRIGLGYTGVNDIDLTGTLGPTSNDNLGASVSLSGNLLAAGAVLDDGAGDACSDCGAVYLFTFANPNFTGGTVAGIAGHGYTFGQSINLAGLLDPADNFGWSVSLFGERIAAGAPGDDGASNSCPACGAVYVIGRLPIFSEDPDAPPIPLFGGLSVRGRIGDGYLGGASINLAGTLNALDQLGTSVSWDGSRIVAGAVGDDGAANDCGNCGAAYLFTYSNLAFFSGGTLRGRIGNGYTGLRDVDLVGGAAPFNIFANDGFGDQAANTVTIPVAALKTLLDAGTSVALQASNDITISGDVFVSNPLGGGGSLTLQAGRSVFFNADIETDGGNLTVLANQPVSAGVINANRDSGVATIVMAPGTSIDTRCKPTPTCFGDVRLTIGGDTLKTNHATGDIVLQRIFAGSLIAENLGVDAGDVIIRDQLQTFESGASLILASLHGDFRNENTPLGQTILTTGPGHFLIYSQSPGGSLFGPLLGRHKNNVIFNPGDADGTFGAAPQSPFDGWHLFRQSAPHGINQALATANGQVDTVCSGSAAAAYCATSGINLSAWLANVWNYLASWWPLSTPAPLPSLEATPPLPLIPNIGLSLNEFVQGGVAGTEQNHHGQYVDDDRNAALPGNATKIHPGIDIAAPEGAAIHAFASGTVIAVMRDDGTGKTLGNAIVVELDQKDADGNTIYALYAHLRDDPTALKGVHFNRGEEIAKVGSTGAADGPHLHFELRYFNAFYLVDGWSSATYGKVGSEGTLRAKWIDPSPYISGYSKPACPSVCTVSPR